MFIAQELIRALVMLVNIFFTIIYWMLVIRIILSWIGVSPHTHYNELLGMLFQVTDMVLAPFRRLPLQIGMFDFSMIIAFVALQFLQRVLVLSLYQIGGF